MKTASPQEVFPALKKHENSIIIDVRSADEHRIAHIRGAQNIPIKELVRHIDELKKYDRIYVHCNTGNTSMQACKKLQQLGLKNLVNIEGGLVAWEKCDFPVTKLHTHSISITRQVMLTAGGLVIASCILGHFVHPGWYGLALFVGAGLCFAGITGICAMAKVLAKMPWNK